MEANDTRVYISKSIVRAYWSVDIFFWFALVVIGSLHLTGVHAPAIVTVTSFMLATLILAAGGLIYAFASLDAGARTAEQVAEQPRKTDYETLIDY